MESANAGKSPHRWTSQITESRPSLTLSAISHTTAATGSVLAWARLARTGITASQSITDERIGNRGSGTRDAGDGAN